MARKSAGYLFQRGEVFWLEYFANGKRIRQSLGVSTRKEAEKERARIMHPLTLEDEADRRRAVADAVASAEDQARQALEATRPKLAVADAWAAFASASNRPQCKPITLADYASRWAVFAAWWPVHAAGRPALEQVSTGDAKAFAQHLGSQGLSPNRYNKIIQTCRLVCAVLASERQGLANPFGATAREGIRNQQLQTVSRRDLSEGELVAVCDAATGELRVLLAMGIYCGQRLNDLVLLRWEQVDLGQGRIRFTPSKTASRGGKPIIVPIHATLKSILLETALEDRRDYVMPGYAARHLADRTAVSKIVSRHFEACGITTQADAGTKHKRSLVGLHSLRHSFVSLCARKGVPLPVVQALCGHSSAAIQQHYLHMGEDVTRAAIDSLPSLAAGASKATPAALPTVTGATAAERRLAAALARLAAGGEPVAVLTDLQRILEG